MWAFNLIHQKVLLRLYLMSVPPEHLFLALQSPHLVQDSSRVVHYQYETSRKKVRKDEPISSCVRLRPARHLHTIWVARLQSARTEKLNGRRKCLRKIVLGQTSTILRAPACLM